MKTYLKRLSTIFIALMTIALFTSCGKGGSSYNNSGGGNNGGGNNGGGSNSVSIANFAFSSSDITVTKGTTVTWKNNDGVTHTVTADDGSFDSGSLTPGKSFSHKFDSTGTFTYHCNIHTMMTGKVTVQ